MAYKEYIKKYETQPTKAQLRADMEDEFLIGYGDNVKHGEWEPDDYNGLTFTADAEQTIKFASAPTGVTKYSYDGAHWTEWTSPTTPLTFGQDIKHRKIMLKGTSNSYNAKRFIFGNATPVYASGDIMSLLDNGQCTARTVSSYNCFTSLFSGCSQLVTPPELPATAVNAWSGYCKMFCDCTNLKVAPNLPATNIGNYCYYNMFSGCTGLEKAMDRLPATTLAENCYSNMFKGCSSLKKAPVLPATSLTKNCYFAMFSSATSLTEITCYATDISGNNCIAAWLYNVAPMGVIYCVEGVAYPVNSTSGIPTGWLRMDL